MPAINPLPSLLRASAFDAANQQMRSAGRKKWNDDDWNLNADTLERLITSCYQLPRDHNEPRRKYIRFQLAEQLEKQGDFHLKSDCKQVMAWIDDYLDQQFSTAA